MWSEVIWGKSIPERGNGGAKVLRHEDFCVLKGSKEVGWAGDVAGDQIARAL